MGLESNGILEPETQVEAAADHTAEVTGPSSTQEDGDEVDVLRGELDRLRGVLQERPSAPDDLLGIIEANLKRGLSPDTWTELSTAIASYFGDENSRAMLWLFEAATGRVPQFASIGMDPNVRYMLERVAALHGPELEAAYDASGVSLDDWRFIKKNVYFDHANDRYVIRLEVVKFGGDQVLLECSANSALNLCRWILTYLTLIAENKPFDATLVDSFKETSELLVQLAESGATPVQDDETPTG